MLSLSVQLALLEVYPVGIKCTTKHKNTPLHDACKHGASLSVVELLLDKYPDALQQRNAEGALPIDRARANGAKSNVIKLLENAMALGASQSGNHDPEV